MPTNYKKRLNLPLDGLNDIQFYTKSGSLVAKGYKRVVIGDRGPYIEFDRSQIEGKSFFIPDNAKYRLSDKRVYYVEGRSKDESLVKLYYQTKTVEYADYKVGMAYISPFDLTSDKYEVLIEPLKKSNERAKRTDKE